MRKKKEVIVPTSVRFILPIMLTLGLFIILHGHLSPGGGFQGGVILAGVVLLIYFCGGYKKVNEKFKKEDYKFFEGVWALAFVFLGIIGLVVGTNFFTNVLSLGNPGDLISSGTIFMMNFAVGFKVFAGITFLIAIFIGLLRREED